MCDSVVSGKQLVAIWKKFTLHTIFFYSFNLRGREREREREEGTEMERERIPIRFLTVSAEPDEELKLMNCEIMT